MNSTAPLRSRQEGSNPVGIHFSGSRRRAFPETACAFLGDSRLSSASHAYRFPPETAVAEPLCSNLFRMIDLQKSIKTNNFNSLQNLYLQKTWGVGGVMVNQRLSTFNLRLSTFNVQTFNPFPLATIFPCLHLIPLRTANSSPPPPIPERVSTASSPPNAPSSAALASRN